MPKFAREYRTGQYIAKSRQRRFLEEFEPDEIEPGEIEPGEIELYEFQLGGSQYEKA